MKILRSPAGISKVVRRAHQQGKRIGLVPTMGALHEGHASLIRAARAGSDLVIVSIFVNPLQFGPQEDFRRYPRRLAQDRRLAEAAGADVIFAPSAAQLYPRGFCSHVDAGPLGERWEGHTRPGHFRGVATVVALLFQLTRPASAYFGQKDYQQALIIQRLVRDLRFPIRVHVLPTVREPDGLAMSSRNAYLSPADRRQATALFQALSEAAARVRARERRADVILEAMRRRISEEPNARVDYVTAVDAKTLEPVWRLRGRVALLAAAWVGRTRLIDNLLVDVP